MAEKVIHEMRFIETDDGYRLEVKGDKELMRKMFMDYGMGFGPWMRFWRRRRSKGWRPWKHGPWDRGWWDDEPEEDEAPADPEEV